MTARIVVPLKVSEDGKAAFQEAAAKQGYDEQTGEGYGYTAWMRDVLAREALNPKHRPRPSPPPKPEKPTRKRKTKKEGDSP